MEKRRKIMSRIQEHLDHYKNVMNGTDESWVGIFLQGSQNYGLDYDGSDIDTKIIVLPEINDVILNHRPISTTSILPNDEHMDVKDIRLMFECFKKQNINFVEILFTDYAIINPLYADEIGLLLKHREEIGRYNNYAAISCMMGTVNEKYKALKKPHPSAAGVVEKYGYDPKQLHHMQRILEFCQRWINGEPYADCLKSRQRELLIRLKCIGVDEAFADFTASQIVKSMEDLTGVYKNEHPIQIRSEVDTLLKSVLTSIIRKRFILELGEELRNESP